jgi:hypothetical protein
MRRALLGALCLAAACAPPEPRVGKARLAEADGVIDAPASSVVVEVPGELPASLGGVVRVAADRDAAWSDVVAVIEKIRAAGGQPVLLVARRGDVKALPPPAAPAEGGLRLVARKTDHQVCVTPDRVQLQLDPSGAKIEERSCVARSDYKHIDRAHVRYLVRESIKDQPVKHVRATIDPALSWADAIRAIDGARTCCGDARIDVELEGLAP